MKDHRQGNDLAVLWSILKDGEPFDLRGRSLKLYLKNLHERKEVVDFSVTGNEIHWTFYGKDQDTLGKHSLILVANEDERGMITTDACDFVRLVSCSCKLQGGEDAPNVETETIELTSTLEYVAGWGGDITIDTELSETSQNAIANAAVTSELNKVSEELKKKLSVDVVIAPTNDAQVLMSAFKTYDLANKLNVPMQCLIKKERSDEDYMLATLIVEDYRSVNAGYRLTFTMYGNKTNAISGGKIDEQSVYSPDAQSVDNILSYLYNEQYGYVIPLGAGNPVFPKLENKVKEMLKGKVDAEKGKGLSSNDFTDTDKEKLDGLKNYDDSELRDEIAKRNVAAVEADGSVDEPEIGGGGGSGMTTPSGDPMHYLYVTAGAEYNDTGVDIERTGMYGDTIVWKNGYWWLNELGDITNDQMRAIFVHWQKIRVSSCYYKAPIRTNLPFACNISNPTSDTRDLLSSLCYWGLFETFDMRVSGINYEAKPVWSNLFNNCCYLKKLLGEINAPIDAISNHCFYWIEEMRLKGLKTNWSMSLSKNFSNASILFAINNEAATSAITITLHANAYARAMADAEILAALEAHPNISLASA